MRTDKIALLTDSCADIPVEVARKNHIYVVPFTITFEEGSYQDGVDIFPDDVYRRQPNEVIKTSLPSRRSHRGHPAQNQRGRLRKSHCHYAV